MKNQYFYTFFLLFSAMSFNNLNGQTQEVLTKNDSLQIEMLIAIQKTYLDAHIPNPSKFDTLLKRDLTSYFSAKFGKVDVKWEFLRDVPTQSGVSYPKYYLWTKIYKGNKLSHEGASRVEAIDKRMFNVTDFVPVNDMKNNNTDIYSVFPGLVCEKIKTLLK